MSNIDGSQDAEIASLKTRIEELEGALRKVDQKLADFGYRPTTKTRKIIAAAL